MKKWALLVTLMMVVSSSMTMAWGPMDPEDKKADPDRDSLGNLEEFRAGTNPLNPDSDGGGCWDGWEVRYGMDPTSPADDGYDIDNDGWTCLREFLEGTDPTNPNTDGDTYPLDSTDPNPLIPDEYDPFIDPGWGKNNQTLKDTDRDFLPDIYEPLVGTDPYNKDSDGDHLLDGREVSEGCDPNDPDTDGDGLLDGQEVPNVKEDVHYTGTSPLREDTDGDGVNDYWDDLDRDGLPNGAEWLYDEGTGLPINWTDPKVSDTDGDSVKDGLEVAGNPANRHQTSDPTMKDTDGDTLMDDIDPHTWTVDHLPYSRIVGTSGPDPSVPRVVSKGVPFYVVGLVEFNRTAWSGPGTGMWGSIEHPMVVQVWVDQDGTLVPISDPVATGQYGYFKISCTVGDGVRAGIARLVITTDTHRDVAYLPCVWDDLTGNELSGSPGSRFTAP